MNTQPLQEYISRLSGRPVAVDEIVSLSSAQQAAVRSWLRNNKDFGVPAQVKSRVSVRMLVNAQEPAGDGAAAPLMETPISIPPVERGGAIAAVGVDIEHVSVLPEAEELERRRQYLAGGGAFSLLSFLTGLRIELILTLRRSSTKAHDPED
jgi:hypothetical protein